MLYEPSQTPEILLIRFSFTHHCIHVQHEDKSFSKLHLLAFMSAVPREGERSILSSLEQTFQWEYFGARTRASGAFPVPGDAQVARQQGGVLEKKFKAVKCRFGFKFKRLLLITVNGVSQVSHTDFIFIEFSSSSELHSSYVVGPYIY